MKKQQTLKTEEQKFAEARDKQWLWKTKAMQDMALRIVNLALDKDDFSTNDLPQDVEQGGSGIAGSIIHNLATSGIIKKKVKFFGTETYYKMIPSERKDGRATILHVWTLASEPLARAFLGAKHRQKELHQPQLIAA